jgi:hypothetical protein
MPKKKRAKGKGGAPPKDMDLRHALSQLAYVLDTQLQRDKRAPPTGAAALRLAKQVGESKSKAELIQRGGRPDFE